MPKETHRHVSVATDVGADGGASGSTGAGAGAGTGAGAGAYAGADAASRAAASTRATQHKTLTHAKIHHGAHDYNLPDHITFESTDLREDVHIFNAEWDGEGVYFYQAFNDDIADYALAHQRFGGAAFKPLRMTWIKPSFAWVLYRSRYAKKHSQNRILKVKLTHVAVAELLALCQCKHGGGGSKGRVQWDPERDIMHGNGAKQHEPRKMLRRRAIQIGLSHELSLHYVRSVVSIQDVTELSRRVGEAHKTKRPKVRMADVVPDLPNERPYLPRCTHRDLVRLKLLPPIDSS